MRRARLTGAAVGARRCDDGGFSLIEVLIALVILSIGVVGLLFGLTTAIRMGAINRAQSRATTILASAVASVADANPGRNPYRGTCAPAPTYNANAGNPPLAAGYTLSTSVQFLDDSDPIPSNWQWVANCIQNKTQKVTITLALPGGGNPWTIEVLRRPL